MNENEQIKLFGSSIWTLDLVYDVEKETYSVPLFDDYLINDPKGWKRWLQETRRGEKPVLVPPAMAVLDTGVLSHHPILQPRIIEAVDFTGEGPEDREGHGTISAILAAMSSAYSPILSAKVWASDGAPLQEQIERVARGVRWAANRNARVISISLGIPNGCKYVHKKCDPEKLCSAVEYAFNCGSVVVVASEAKCPAECPHAFPVGLWDQKRKKAIVRAPPKVLVPVVWDERSTVPYEQWTRILENNI